MSIKKSIRKGGMKTLRAVMTGVLAVGLMPLPAFAANLQPGTLDLEAQADAMSADGYVIAAAYAAAEPAPELLGLNNPNFRNTGEADNIAVMFGDPEVNENVDPYVYNYTNGLTPGIAVGGRAGSPMSALNTYDATDSTAAQNAVWAYLPQIVLGTGGDAIPENEHDFYIDNGAAAVVETALGLEEGSYKPIGVTYNRKTLPDMIETMYRLAEAAEEAMANDATLTTRYEDPLEIAKDYERYVVGAKGLVLQAINEGTVPLRTIALVQSYDSDAQAYTIITDGVAEGTATTNRYLEAVQGVSKNYYDTAGATVTAAQLKADVDVLIIGGQASQDISTLSPQLAEDGLLAKSYFCTNWGQGAVFGVTVNSVENAQNIGRILPCVYPEVLDQSDMIAFYYDVFYHIKDGALASMIDENMDGIRNWDKADSASYTDWVAADVAGYNHDDVEAMLSAGVAYLQSQEGMSSYLTPTEKVDLAAFITVTSDEAIEMIFGETATIEATANSGAELTYKSSDESVATVDATGKVTAVGSGEATITVAAAATDTYGPATKDVTVTVGKSSQSVTVPTVAAKTFGTDLFFKLGAETSGDGVLSYTSSNENVAVVSNTGTVALVGAGTATITVKAAESDNCKASDAKTVKITVNKGANTMAVAYADQATSSVTFKTSAQTIANPLAVSGAKGTVKYAKASGDANFKVNATTGDITVAKNTPAGTYTLKIKVTDPGNDNYKGANVTKSVKVVVNKAANTLTVAAKSSTLSAKAKSATTFAASKAFNVKKNVSKGAVTYTKTSGNSKITVASNGKVTVAKGLKAGSTYTVKVKATSAATDNYKAATATITLKIKVS